MSDLTAEDIGSVLRAAPPSDTAAWRALCRKWARALADQPPEAVIRIAEQLIGQGAWDRLTAYELIATHPRAIQALRPASIGRLARGLSDWPGVDTFGCLVAGPAWREGRLGTRTVQGWARSQDRWKRRLALVSTVALNVRARGGQGDVGRTLGVCAQLIHDRDDMVVKALSWALRALVQWDRAAVRQFLRDHGSELAARVRREVVTKLRTGRKAPPPHTRR
jgi:3-methyladenine DNA glycosylase AlkD